MKKRGVKEVAVKNMLVTLLVILPLSALGGEKGDRKEDGDRAPAYVTRMTERLDLTDEQSAQLQEIFHSHRQQMRTLREDTEQKVDALLSESQRAALQALKAERGKERRQSRDKASGGSKHDDKHDAEHERHHKEKPDS